MRLIKYKWWECETNEDYLLGLAYTTWEFFCVWGWWDKLLTVKTFCKAEIVEYKNNWEGMIDSDIQEKGILRHEGSETNPKEGWW